ncbi:hypothetical protein [Mesorhizobium sp. B2-4-6]|uniref:hypothetical protein n=1 Tax=Mesorhizobium sp. B2-4-6 TaxID=2589943 RepID=UPI0011284345|nr:hypothetical protein [Mesorhizobium sp. B2-4-6]TPL40188.1 hypothetical protein FJ957_27180 [Mesorhizobium sp. B2-4-6]
MKRRDKAAPFVPTEIHVVTVDDDSGTLGILSIRTAEGILEIALDRQAADAVMHAIGTIRLKLDPGI